MNTFNIKTLQAALCVLASFSFTSVATADHVIDEIVVSADFRDTKLLESAASITVLSPTDVKVLSPTELPAHQHRGCACSCPHNGHRAARTLPGELSTYAS